MNQTGQRQVIAASILLEQAFSASFYLKAYTQT